MTSTTESRSICCGLAGARRDAFPRWVTIDSLEDVLNSTSVHFQAGLGIAAPGAPFLLASHPPSEVWERSDTGFAQQTISDFSLLASL